MPSSKAFSIYASGYTEEKKAQVEATKLPEKLKCKACKKLKVPDGFSKNQLLGLKHRVAKNPRLAEPTSATVVCRQCMGGQVHELQCSQCDQIKSLDGFTKAQRRDPDKARCIKCVNHDLNTATAGSTDPDYGNDDNGSNDDQSDGGVTNPYAESTSIAGTVSHAATSLNSGFGNLKLQDSDDDDNPKARSRSKSGSTVNGARYSSSIAPRSNFNRPRNANTNPGGTIHETEAAKQAVGRQVYRNDSSSDDEYGYI